MKTADELRKELAAAEKAEREEGDLAGKALRRVYVYTVQWVSPHVFKCLRFLDEESVKGFEEWRKKYPKHSTPWDFSDDGKRKEGMNYYLIEGWIARAGGGTLVLETRADRTKDVFFDDEPLKLTAEQVAALRAGIVPDELKSR